MKALRPPVAAGLAILALGALLGPEPASAGDVTAFVALPRPSDTWERGYGAALSSTWFNVLTFEGEAARVPGTSTDEQMTSFTASALVSPPVGAVTPYGGLGIGLFRQTVAEEADTGRLRAWILGAKVKLGGLLVLKGEYRRFELSGEPLLPMDSRISVGAGIAF